MNIFNKASRGIMHDETNPVDVALKQSQEEYCRACDNLDIQDPLYNKQLNLLKKKEAQKRFDIQWLASGGFFGFILRTLFYVSIIWGLNHFNQ